MAEELRHLFEPITLRDVTIPNRLIFAPHGPRFVNLYQTQQHVDYLAERAKGGVGMIVFGGLMVHDTSLATWGVTSAADDGAIPGLRAITAAVHEHDTKILGQLSHMGRQGTGWASRRELWAPSAIPCNLVREVPHEMTRDEIEELIEAYRLAARRALSAGFDGFEVYLAHGYLLCEFVSAYSNHRTDEYGGCLDNRMRIVRRVIDTVRAEVGEGVPIGCRITADEFVTGGLTLEESQQVAEMLEDTRKVDFLAVTQCNYSSIYTMIPDMSFPPACFSYLAAGVKRSVSLPVATVARISDPILAERLIAEGQADLIYMCRALIADPELPNKAREGRLDEIRTCIACNVGCRGAPLRGLPVTCLQNPAVGIERQAGIGTRRPAPVRKKVLVVGGGPAGLKAAEEAAERGHKVTLFEKEHVLGGQVVIAAKAPTRDEFAGSVRHLQLQLDRLGVQVRLGVTVTPEVVDQERPDVVVVATGSVARRPPISGADHPNVFDAAQVLEDPAAVGERVIVSNQGGEADWKFCSTADFLASRGKKVEMVTQLSDVGVDLDANSKAPTLLRLRQNGVVFTPYTEIKAISGTTVTVADVWTGAERRIDDVDSVVFAWFNKANDGLFTALNGRVPESYLIGDALAPRKAIDAIREGFLVGRKLSSRDFRACSGSRTMNIWRSWRVVVAIASELAILKQATRSGLPR